jgi:hypothetical protein
MFSAIGQPIDILARLEWFLLEIAFDLDTFERNATSVLHDVREERVFGLL